MTRSSSTMPGGVGGSASSMAAAILAKCSRSSGRAGRISTGPPSASALDANANPTANTTDGQVMTCTIGNCQPVALASNLKAAVGIAIDSQAIYFLTYMDGQVWKLAK